MLGKLNGVCIMLAAAQPQFLQDALRLGRDIIGWLIAISAVVAVIWLIIEGMKWYQADENEKKPHLKKIKGIFIGAVGVILAEYILTFIMSYFIH